MIVAGGLLSFAATAVACLVLFSAGIAFVALLAIFWFEMFQMVREWFR